MDQGRIDADGAHEPTAALLPDGRVLVAGGYFHHAPDFGTQLGSEPILAAYRPDEPAAGSATGPPLLDIVPPNVGAALATAEVFDPTTGAWELTGSMRVARYGAAAVTLADSRILIVGSMGGGSVTVDAGAAGSAEIYDPATGRFEATEPLPPLDWEALEAQGVPPVDNGIEMPGETGTLVALSDGGAVLIGHSGWWKHVGGYVRSFRFHPDSNRWDEIGEPYVYWTDPSGGPEYETAGVVARFSPLAARLPDGRVVVAGGMGSSRPFLSRSIRLRPTIQSRTRGHLWRRCQPRAPQPRPSTWGTVPSCSLEGTSLATMVRDGMLCQRRFGCVNGE